MYCLMYNFEVSINSLCFNLQCEWLLQRRHEGVNKEYQDPEEKNVPLMEQHLSCENTGLQPPTPLLVLENFYFRILALKKHGKCFNIK